MADLSEHLGERAAFFAIVEGTAFPFVAAGERHFVCKVPDLVRAEFRFRDRAGNALPGARLSLSRAGVPARLDAEDGVERTAMAGVGAAPVHSVVTDATGMAVVSVPAAGAYCFDLGLLGYVRVAGPDPDREWLQLPAPITEFVMEPVAVLVVQFETGARLLGESRWQPEIAASSRTRAVGPRDLARLTRHIRRDFPDATLVTAMVDEDRGPARCRWTIDALATIDGSVGRVRATATPVPLHSFTAPVLLAVAASERFDAGSLKIDVTAPDGSEVTGLAVRLLPRGAFAADAGITGFTAGSGRPHALPPDVYRVELTLPFADDVVGAREVTVIAGQRATCRIALPHPIVRYHVELDVPGGAEALSGASVQIHQQGMRRVAAGADGNAVLGPFHHRPGPLRIDVAAVGFAREMVEVTLAPDQQLVTVPLRPER